MARSLQVQSYKRPLPQYTTSPRVLRWLLTSLLELTQMRICVSRSHSLQHAVPMRTGRNSFAIYPTKRQTDILVFNIIPLSLRQVGIARSLIVTLLMKMGVWLAELRNAFRFYNQESGTIETAIFSCQ